MRGPKRKGALAVLNQAVSRRSDPSRRRPRCPPTPTQVASAAGAHPGSVGAAGSSASVFGSTDLLRRIIVSGAVRACTCQYAVPGAAQNTRAAWVFGRQGLTAGARGRVGVRRPRRTAQGTCLWRSASSWCGSCRTPTASCCCGRRKWRATWLSSPSRHPRAGARPGQGGKGCIRLAANPKDGGARVTVPLAAGKATVTH